MDTRPLGGSGLQTSVIGLGANNFGRRIDLDGTRTVVDEALEQGITFFDTANTYSRGQSEEYLGEVLQGRRDQYRPGEAAPAGARLSDRDEIATPAQFALIAALEHYVGGRGVSLLDEAIGALLANETVSSVIDGATRPRQVRANRAAARWHPSAEDMSDLRALLAAQTAAGINRAR
jgi:aryl-alcohol dehydrogenase-like predicted oxidoreductase